MLSSKHFRTASARDYHRITHPSVRTSSLTTQPQYPSPFTRPHPRPTGILASTPHHPATGCPPSIRQSGTGSIPGSLSSETAQLLLGILFELLSIFHNVVSTAINTMSGGWNPVTGRDARGSRPPHAPYGAPVLGQSQPYIPPTAGPGWQNWACANSNPWQNWNASAYANNYVGWPQQPWSQGATTCTPACASYPYSAQPNGTGNYGVRMPQGWPNIDSAMPAAQMTNSSGGMGCEPGYNYFFPAEHTKAHIFHSNTAPWQLPAGAQIKFRATHIPCSTTLGELLKGFGCCNETAKKNRCFEITPGGNGSWYKGFCFNGGEKDMVKKTVGEIGWDRTRSGHPNEKPVVCLWFVRD